VTLNFNDDDDDDSYSTFSFSRSFLCLFLVWDAKVQHFVKKMTPCIIHID